MSRFKTFIFVLLAVALVSGSAFAQVGRSSGKIQGKVTDEQGVALPGVTVEATSPRLVGTASSITDEGGAYRIFSLPSGTYTFTFSLPGFKQKVRKDIILQLEQTITLNETLNQSAVAEEITVIGQSPLIDVKSTTKGMTMNKEVFMQLPRSRDFTGLLSTVPGVQYEGNQGGYSVDGASGDENTWYIDGTNITNMRTGGQTQSMVMEQVEEVKVTASGYNAEFGGSMGGVVNVISRSGGNEFHGDVFGYYNNQTLLFQGKSRDALRLNPYDNTKAEYYNSDDLYYNGGKDRDAYNRYEGVFNLGGFIFKDRLWFFGSFNPTFGDTYANRWFTTDPVDLTQAKVPGDTVKDPRQGRQLYNDFYTKNRYYYWQAKLTAQPLKGMRVSLSGNSNFYNTTGSIPGITGTSAKNTPWIKSWTNTIAPDMEPGYHYPNMSFNANLDYTVSNNLMVSLRGGYNFTDTTDQAIAASGTKYAFGTANIENSYFPYSVPANLGHYSGWTNFAPSLTTIAANLYERFSGNLDLTYYFNFMGEHSVKGGVQYVRNHEDISNGYQHPYVSLYWGDNQFYTRPDGSKVQGTYGYYTVVGDWKSPYGYVWNIHNDCWAIYLQDSWTITDRFTLNFGLRTESEYIPAFTPDSTNVGYSERPISFGFGDKLAPRLGAIYDVFGDSSMKVFASFGVYYDVMKLYVAEGAFGGNKWWTSYYTLDNLDFTKIAASGDMSNKADQAAGGTYITSRNWRATGFDRVDPGVLPIAQSEFSFGAEKKISEELSASARVVYKHLIRTIEDIGVMLTDEEGNTSENYFYTNPGLGYARPISEGGKLSDAYWPCPKAKREYWGVNLSLDKRFSNNWQGGVSYTWSSLRGNYGGLASSDEAGRHGANADRYFDMWFERYDVYGNPLDGILPSDRTHYLKAYGSYAFPFGLTVGVVGYGRSGLPRSTTISFKDMTMLPNGYDDLGRLPFTAWADAYLEYNLRILKKYTVNLNATFSNITGTSTIQGYFDTPTRVMIGWTDEELMSKTKDWKDEIATHTPDPRYGMWSSRYNTFSWRLGARISF
jgi:hypothetical protein